jgi:hypothetical protein
MRRRGPPFAVVPLGTTPTFKVRVKGKGVVYTFTPEKFTFPEYYLNRAGTYYWQAYRIFCIRIRNRRAFDCIQEGPIRKFQVQ